MLVGLSVLHKGSWQKGTRAILVQRIDQGGKMKKLYEILVNERERDCQRYWAIFGVMNVINSGLLVFSLSQKSAEKVLLASFLGLVLCVLWWGAVLRMAGWVDWWEDKIKEIEMKSPFENLEANDESAGEDKPDTDAFKIFVGRRGSVRRGISTRVVGWLLPVIFFVAWLGIHVLTWMSMPAGYVWSFA